MGGMDLGELDLKMRWTKTVLLKLPNIVTL